VEDTRREEIPERADQRRVDKEVSGQNSKQLGRKNDRGNGAEAKLDEQNNTLMEKGKQTWQKCEKIRQSTIMCWHFSFNKGEDLSPRERPRQPPRLRGERRQL